MSKPEPNTLEFLLQEDVIAEFLPSIGKDQWQMLYCSSDNNWSRFGVSCALLDKGAADKAMEHDGWDLMIGDGMPGFSQSWSEDGQVTTYHRFGGASAGLRPFVLRRSFYGAFPSYLEMDEEFRLFHDLAEDKERGLLLAFDASGREIEVVRIYPTEAHARLKYLRQFQAATGLYLAIFIDSVRYSKVPLSDIPADRSELIEEGDMFRWRRGVANCDFVNGAETFSRLLGKVIIAPPTQDKSGVWPYEANDDQKEVSFVIGVDEDGNEVEHTSDPGKLDNYFGANPGSPHYLTPVYFRREVLTKYYSESDRYSVTDGQLSCLHLWSCQIDNDHESYVVVFLGDLGRDLPYEERLHWRQYNIAPEGGVSETTFRRSFLAQFADAQTADLEFRRKYNSLVRDWEKVHGWSLFLAPSSGDAHLLDTIRIPVTNSQAELDEQIGHLTKLLIDSLNEKELAALASDLEAGAKGISKLAGFLEATQFPEHQPVIQLFRDLQTLRSTGSAHRKGSGYEKIIAKLGVQPGRKPDAVRRLLEEAIVVLDALRQHYLED